MSSKESDSIDIGPIITKHKIKILILIIILLGLSLRAYHADYPVVGYHNWKETHYLTEARNFAQDGFFSEGFFIPSIDYPNLNADPSGAHSDTFPTVSIVVALAFKIFGESLLVARSVIILFSLGTILAMYLLVKELFKREDMALVAAGLTAINPLFVFFSHNVQLMPPGLFFMIFGSYFYVKWVRKLEPRNILYAAILLTLGVLTKYTYFIILLPLLLIFPVSKLKTILKNYKLYIAPFAVSLALPIWYVYASSIGTKTSAGLSVLQLIDISVLFQSGWWRSIQSYSIDNYTTFGMYFALIGLIAAIHFYQKNKGLGEQFLLAYGGSTVLFVILLSQKLGGHSYHQFPIAPFFILLMTYSFVVVSSTLSNIFLGSVKGKEKIVPMARIGIILLFFAILYYGGSAQSIDRQFNVQFPGLDVGGDYIRQNSNPGERLLFSSGGQSYGVLWHSGLKSYDDGLNSIETIKEAESRGPLWLFIYSWGLNDIGTPKWDYISENYHIENVGFMGSGQDTRLQYLVLKQGGSFDIDDLNSLIQNKPIQQTTYELTHGTFTFNSVTVV